MVSRSHVKSTCRVVGAARSNSARKRCKRCEPGTTAVCVALVWKALRLDSEVRIEDCFRSFHVVGACNSALDHTDEWCHGEIAWRERGE